MSGLKIKEWIIIFFISTLPLIRVAVTNGHEEGMIICCCIFLLAIYGHFLFIKKKEMILKISKFDVAIWLLVIYVIIRNSLSIDCFDIYTMIRSLCCLSVFYFAKQCNKTIVDAVEIGLILSGSIQAIICLLQTFHIVESNHAILLTTGSFDNPAYCGMYMALVFPFVVIRMINLKEYPAIIQYLLLMSFTVILATLIISESRTSWICTTIILVSIFYADNKNIVLSIFKNHKFLISISSALFFLSIIGLLYYIKPVSANSRLYIWYITLRCFLENPIVGVGRSYSYFYMNNQAEYLMTNQDSPFYLMADNIHHCYNELLQVLIQYGLIGLILVVFIIIWIFKIKSQNKVIKASFNGILIASMFTYTTTTFLFLLLISFYIGVLSKGENQRMVYTCSDKNDKRYLRQILFLIKNIYFLGFIYIFVFNVFALYYWAKGTEAYNFKCFEEAEDCFKKSEFILRSNGSFLNLRAKNMTKLGECELSNKIMERAILIRYSTFSEIMIGDNYNELGENDNSEKAYYKAYAMVPSKMYPLYLIAVQQYKNKEYERFKITATKIMNMPIKAESTANIQMKAEISHYFDHMVSSNDDRR
ncbi:MAG: O-antigen ligase family protein [Bacteroides sp.]|nr:O-antigen ligase family protein [Bacteroides sp.]